MSRAQGDNYRTHTNHELNAYRARLDAKQRKLADHKERWYRIGEGWVHVEEKNRMFNPISDWKWEGWEVQAREYWIKVFPGECVAIRDGKPRVIGLAQIIKVIDDDRAAANTFFQEVAAPIARNLKNWIPDEANNRVFFDYPGRKPKATITMSREDYTFGLVVDGEEVMRSKEMNTLEAEAERIGAELIETHTP